VAAAENASVIAAPNMNAFIGILPKKGALESAPFANNANLIRAVSSHEVWLRPNAIQDGAALKTCRTGDLPQRNLRQP
jgi:hypothetical protein